MAPDPARPRFSLVIPAYNERDYLPRLLDTVDLARGRYRAGAEAVEVIVADNASTDDTAEIARRRGCRVVAVERRAIAASRNGGAGAARGDLLCFVDADFRIHPDTFAAVEDCLTRENVVGGSTGCRLERMSVGLAMTFLACLPLVWTTGMDTGVVFCRREDFEAIGGYDETMIFAEDVRFLWALKKLGRARGQRLVRARQAKALASTRKFDRHGDWHYFTGLPRFLWWLAFSRRSLDRWARSYWYER